METNDHCWKPVVESDRDNTALAVATKVIKELRERNRVLQVSREALQQTRFPMTVHWEPLGIAQGDAGLALMCSYLDACFPLEGWDVIGHEYLSWAVRGAETVGYPPLGLFAGLAGLAFAARSLCRNGIRYQRLLNALEGTLSTRALKLASALTGRHGIAVAEFDLITGLCGVGAYLLWNRPKSNSEVALRAILNGMVQLTEKTNGTPHWFTPSHLIADKSMAEIYPNGHLNCGLAHGIPGPLALMALALDLGFTVDGLREAVERTADWILQHRTSDDFGLNWPTAVPCSEGDTVESGRLDPSRAAWCYGTPGVSRALWLAGRALGDQNLAQIAIEGMEAVFRRPISLRQIDSPTFCHGIAGLLQVTARFYHDTGLALFKKSAASLLEQLLSQYDPKRPFGFASIEPGGNLVDQPGLLDGAPGVVLAILAATIDIEPTWDRMFLLS
jgi:lantibiotic biosynthesis protein